MFFSVSRIGFDKATPMSVKEEGGDYVCEAFTTRKETELFIHACGNPLYFSEEEVKKVIIAIHSRLAPSGREVDFLIDSDNVKIENCRRYS